MDPLTILAIAALWWFLIHAALAGTSLRRMLAARLGENGFRGFFSLLSLASLSALIWAYGRSPCAPLWIPPRPLLYLPILIMPIAFTLLVGAFTVKNPTAVGAEAALGRTDPARGALRITRHPFLWAVTAWAAVHLAINGNVASVLFFGSMLLTALVGMRDIDRKRREAHPELWTKYEAVTSSIPFAAIATGRNRLVAKELALPAVIGAALTAVLLVFHRDWFHVSPLP